MPALLTFLLLLAAGVLFALAAFNVPLRKINTVAAGLLLWLIAVALGPALVALF